MIYEII